MCVLSHDTGGKFVTNSLSDSSVHGILQARVMERVAIPFSGWSSQSRDRTWIFHLSHQGKLIHIHISIFFKMLFPNKPLQSATWSSLCYIVGPY